MQTNKNDLLRLEAYINSKYRTVATEVRRALIEAPIPIWQRDYMVLEQIADVLYSRMLDNPYKDPLDLAKDLMDEMYADFLKAKGERPDSSINSSN